jgi:hypothetical protein
MDDLSSSLMLSTLTMPFFKKWWLARTLRGKVYGLSKRGKK